MNDLTVAELVLILKSLPQDARVSYHSGENKGLLYIQSKNGRKSWDITQEGKITK